MYLPGVTKRYFNLRDTEKQEELIVLLAKSVTHQAVHPHEINLMELDPNLPDPTHNLMNPAHAPVQKNGRETVGHFHFQRNNIVDEHVLAGGDPRAGTGKVFQKNIGAIIGGRFAKTCGKSGFKTVKKTALEPFHKNNSLKFLVPGETV